MVDRHRGDTPGAWHHVVNRGVARRTVIEGSRDAAEFLACVQRVVEEGLLEVHAYSLMGTHYHLLVRSPRGELARAMMLVQNRYSRWFNRGRRRDGPLWRGRFLSKLVRSNAYWRVLVRYIDQNAVMAKIVAAPDQYQLGSAWHYSRKQVGPPWLHRAVIEQVVRTHVGKADYAPSDYVAVFGAPLSRSAHWMIERSGRDLADVEATLVHLVSAAPQDVRSWMQRKARLADGSPIVGVGMIDPGVLLSFLAVSEREEPEWFIRPRRHRKPGWRALRCALLHQLCGCTVEDSALRTGIGPSTAEDLNN